MKRKNSFWVLFPAVCFGLGVLSGCETHSTPANAAKPAREARPLFAPVAASLAQQKMCDEQAEKKFKEDTAGSKGLSDFTSHYDPSVNVCFMRVHTIMGSPAMVSDAVFDAFGGRVYADYVWMNPQGKKFWEVKPSTCAIHIPGKPDETCNSQEEFDKLTEKYFGVPQ